MPGSLLSLITAADAATRHQSLDTRCATLTAAELLAECAALDDFRRHRDNLYERVRALFFLYAIHRFHLPAKLAASARAPGRIPFSGYEHLLQRRFEEALECFLAAQSAEMRAKGEAMIQQADRLLCESWNERMWSDGEPIDPSPTIDQAVNGGFPWLEIRCARCKTPSDVDLAAMKHPPTTFVHDLASRLRCRKCAKAGRRPSATLLQLAWQPRHPRTEA